MSDLMSVRLHLSGVRVTRVLVDTVDRLEVEVASTREWPPVPPLWVPLLSGVGPEDEAGSRPGGERPSHHPGLASSPVLLWELRGTPPRGPRPVPSWPHPPVRPSPGPGCEGDVDSGGGPPSWGWLASDHGPCPHRGGSGGGASPDPALSCAVG